MLSIAVEIEILQMLQNAYPVHALLTVLVSLKKAFVLMDSTGHIFYYASEHE
jgi:hypothetical protein